MHSNAYCKQIFELICQGVVKLDAARRKCSEILCGSEREPEACCSLPPRPEIVTCGAAALNHGSAPLVPFHTDRGSGRIIGVGVSLTYTR